MLAGPCSCKCYGRWPGAARVRARQVGDGVFEVLSTSGDTHLGGDDFDKRIVDYLADDFKRSEGIELRNDRQALQRLTEAAEKAKIELSSLTQTSINLPFITATADGPKHIDTTLTRAKFEEMCSDMLERCKIPVQQVRGRAVKRGESRRSSPPTSTPPPALRLSHCTDRRPRARPPPAQALRDAKLNINDIQEVILVGGSTRIPAVQDIVRKLAGKDPNVTVNPDEVVALGAAVQVRRLGIEGAVGGRAGTRRGWHRCVRAGTH